MQLFRLLLLPATLALQFRTELRIASASSLTLVRAPRTVHCIAPSWDDDLTMDRVERLLELKEQSGLTFDQIATALGLTNTYTAQLFLGQAQLKPATATKLKELLPDIEDFDLINMQKPPMRGFDEEILKEPNVYRTYEAITHYGQAIKAIINEQCGDGIMSAIDFYMDVGTTTGKQGEKRVVITFNGKVRFFKC